MNLTTRLLQAGWIGLILCGLSACRSESAVATIETSAPAAPSAERIYVGTYTPQKSKGIQIFKIDPATGGLTSDGLAVENESPSYLALAPSRKLLFAVNEMANLDGKGSGGVSGFSVDPATGKLTLINQQPSGGSGPCHLSLDAATGHVFVANYGSGSIEVLPLDSAGKLGARTAQVQDTDATGGEKPRSPHAHWIGADPTGKFVLACDLGLDSVYVYHFDAGKGTLAPADPPASTCKAGSGPRHLVFSRDGKFAYVICELNSTVIAYAWDAEHGTLKEIQTLSALPANYEGKFASAEIRLHPSGKFLYASNRGNDTITVFQIDPATGMLSVTSRVACGGKTPRGFAVSPSGQWLVVGNQGTDNLVSFKIDPQTGGLTEAAHTDVGAPVDVMFVPEGK